MTENVQVFQALMKRARDGCPEAIGQILATYGRSILRVIRRLLHKKMRSKYDSRDFTQDVWSDFFAQEIKDRDFASPEELRAFLVAIAKNKVMDAYRKRLACERHTTEREKSLDGSAANEAHELTDDTPTPSQVAMTREKWDELRTQLVDGPARRILEMLQQGLGYADIARRLRVSERTVRRVVGRLERDSPRD
jgi:RNA polymerase sigma factor (sigma-70 family)